MSSWRPVRYANGDTVSKRDALPVLAVAALLGAAYLLHDVLGVVPLPSEETMGFGGFLLGLATARRLKP